MNKVTIGEVKISHTLTNTTNMFLVVGNKHAIIGQSDMRVEAESIAHIVGNEHCVYSTIDVVAPGETVSGDFVQPIQRDWDASDDEAVASEFAKMGITL